METVEIRYAKRKLFVSIVIVSLILLAINYHNYFENFEEFDDFSKLIFIIIDAFVIYTIFSYSKKLKKNEPKLRLTTDTLEINDKGITIFQWTQIIDIQIDIDENSSQLIIKTVNLEKKVYIGFLEKTPKEIEKLIREYQKFSKN